MPSLSSADHSVSPPRITIPREYNAAHDLIERNLAAGRANKVAFIDDRGSYTYADVDRRSSAFANVLRELGVDMEQRILLCLHDTIDFPTAFLGAIVAQPPSSGHPPNPPSIGRSHPPHPVPARRSCR